MLLHLRCRRLEGDGDKHVRDDDGMDDIDVMPDLVRERP